ncbi:4'-phosphopantetheinyl transferase superfamily [Crassisporium funariophilum]|nr:4'-phosphopantetheinyl transferase superfamily [Crassisporium funariophilum]
MISATEDPDKPPSWLQLYVKALSRVDQESKTRIMRFYRRDDSCRTLIGRLLVRTMLKDRGIHCDDMKFSATAEGKPYIAIPSLDPPIGYNITHDSGLIAMAFAPGVQNGPAFSIGIDVMKVRIPGRESFSSFVETVGDQLTESEHRLLDGRLSEIERLRRFFWMWTLKEAYTKALGLGLGFDFRRVEFDVVKRVVRVDGHIPQGWRFSMFTVEDGGDSYQGVVAEHLGGGTSTVVISETIEHDWLVTYDAVSFTELAITQLAE